MLSAKSLITAIAATALASQTAAFSMPPCWSSCFQKYNVTTEGSLCDAPLVTVVGTCIASGCAAVNSTSAASEYTSWLSGYCGTSTASNTWTSTAPITTGFSASVPIAAPTGSGSPAPYSNTTTATYSKPAIATGSLTTSTTGPSSTAPVPYTGGAAVMKGAVGGMALLVGGVAGLLL